MELLGGLALLIDALCLDDVWVVLHEVLLLSVLFFLGQAEGHAVLLPVNLVYQVEVGVFQARVSIIEVLAGEAFPPRGGLLVAGKDTLPDFAEEGLDVLLVGSGVGASNPVADDVVVVVGDVVIILLKLHVPKVNEVLVVRADLGLQLELLKHLLVVLVDFFTVVHLLVVSDGIALLNHGFSTI